MSSSDVLRRRQLGAWYTPDALVEFVLDRVGEGLSTPPLRILDPACGDGAFLAGAARRWPSCTLRGVDVDPAAATAATQRLGRRADITLDDALARDWSKEPLADLVVGNPPFLGQMATATSRGGRSKLLGGGAYADTAALFMSLALRLVRTDGGRVAFVLPQSFLATRDVAPIRAAIAEAGAVRSMWLAGEPMFDAGVHTIVLVIERGAKHRPIERWFGPSFEPRDSIAFDHTGTWSPLVADLLGIPPVDALLVSGTLAAHATATADFRDQYYGLIDAVTDDGVGPVLVTSGLIDVGRCAWGERSVRFAKQRFANPRVDVDRLSPALQAWANQRLVPKVLVAAQTQVIEGCADESGSMIPSVPVVSVVPIDASMVWSVAAVLNSPVVSAWAARRTIGSGLQGSALRISARQLIDAPWPDGSLQRAIDALRDGNLEQFAEASCDAFGVPTHQRSPLRAWWLPRASRHR